MISAHDIARWRLRSQHLVQPHAETALDAVGHLVAVQAENPSQSAWAVAARTTRPAPGGSGSRRARRRPAASAPTCCVRRGTTWGPATSAWLLELTGPTRPARRPRHSCAGPHGFDAAGSTGPPPGWSRYWRVERPLDPRRARRRARVSAGDRDRRTVVDDPARRTSSWTGSSAAVARSTTSTPTRCSPTGCRSHVVSDRDRGPSRARAAVLHRARPGHGAGSRLLGHAHPHRRASSALGSRPRSARRRSSWTAGRSGTLPAEPPRRPRRARRRTCCRSSTRPTAAIRTPAGCSTLRRSCRVRGEATIGMALVDAQLVAGMQRTISADRATFMLSPHRSLRPRELSELRRATVRYGELPRCSRRRSRSSEPADARCVRMRHGMKGRHEIAAHPDDCDECRRMTDTGEGEPEWEHLRRPARSPEWRSSMWHRIGGRRTKWFNRHPEDRRY